MNRIASEMFDKIADTLLEQLVVAIKAGASWQSPWARSAATGGPISIDGRAYRGSNAFWLSLLSGDFPAQVFGTYKSWKKHGVQVQKGSTGIEVVLWKRSKIEEKKPDGTVEEKTIMWAKVYKVFAAEQTDVPAEKLERLRKREPLPEGAETHDEAEALTQAYIAAEGVTLAHGGNRAYYAMLQDHVQMPPVEAFHSTEGYYGTLLHELVHSTGHSKRKGREFGKRFGDQAYAFEELVAEIGSAFLCAATGVSTEPRADHAQYLANWIEVLREERGKAILTATSQAQQAADLILQYQQVETEEETEEAA